MANRKLTDLPELLTPANGDFIYIVDVSDTTESPQGTSKKIKKENVGYSFTYIPENEYGTHPAFANQTDLNAYLLGKTTNPELIQLNSLENMEANPISGESILITWNDTND